MTRPDRVHSPNRVPVNCADALTPSGNNIMLLEIGLTSRFVPATFHWCKVHHTAHTLTLTQQLKSYCDIVKDDKQARENYVGILKQALRDMLTEIEDASTS